MYFQKESVTETVIPLLRNPGGIKNDGGGLNF